MHPMPRSGAARPFGHMAKVYGLAVGRIRAAIEGTSIATSGGGTAMDRPDFRIEQLPPMRVARFHAMGSHPELKAWAQLRKWAEPRGLLADADRHPVFGFNNPSPSPGRDEYGYEFWIRIDSGAADDGGVETMAFPGGWYAVTTQHGFPRPDVWLQLFESARLAACRYRATNELERPHDPLAPEADMVFDLYLPIEAPAT
jgi:DNA gyrase inhibitor GyrI